MESIVTAPLEVRLRVSTFLIVDPTAVVKLAAAVTAMFSVSLPAPPSIESKEVKVKTASAVLPVIVSAPVVPVTESTPVVSDQMRYFE